MKRILYSIVFIGLLISTTSESLAGRPPSRLAEGVIEKVDFKNHTLTIRSSGDSEALVFALHDWTKFLEDSEQVSIDRLKAGTSVNYWYRKPLFGDQFVIKVAWKKGVQ